MAEHFHSLEWDPHGLLSRYHRPLDHYGHEHLHDLSHCGGLCREHEAPATIIRAYTCEKYTDCLDEDGEC